MLKNFLESLYLQEMHEYSAIACETANARPKPRVYRRTVRTARPED